MTAYSHGQSVYLVKDIEMLEKVQRWATKCVTRMTGKTYQQRLQLFNITTLEKKKTTRWLNWGVQNSAWYGRYYRLLPRSSTKSINTTQERHSNTTYRRKKDSKHVSNVLISVASRELNFRRVGGGGGTIWSCIRNHVVSTSENTSHRELPVSGTRYWHVVKLRLPRLITV